MKMDRGNPGIRRSDWLAFSLLVLCIGLYVAALPLIPDVDLGPYQAVNPHDIARLLLAIAAVALAGDLSMRLFGERSGLLATGFFGGFASSSATIAAMGSLAKREPELMPAASAAALLSTVATYLQLAFILWLTNALVLSRVALPLLSGGAAAAVFGFAALRSGGLGAAAEPQSGGPLATLRRALLIGVMLTALLMAGSAVQSEVGVEGVSLVSFVSGFVDGHAAAFAVSEMVTLKKIGADAAVIPILLGLTGNTVTKAVLAAGAGGWKYARRVITGLAVSIACTWVPLIFLAW